MPFHKISKFEAIDIINSVSSDPGTLDYRGRIFSKAMDIEIGYAEQRALQIKLTNAQCSESPRKNTKSALADVRSAALALTRVKCDAEIAEYVIGLQSINVSKATECIVRELRDAITVTDTAYIDADLYAEAEAAVAKNRITARDNLSTRMFHTSARWPESIWVDMPAFMDLCTLHPALKSYCGETPPISGGTVPMSTLIKSV